MAPGGGEQFDHPLIAVLVAHAERVGIGAVRRAEELQGLPVVQRRALQFGGLGRGKEDDGDIAGGGVVGTQHEAGHALVVDPGLLFVAGVVELSHRPGRVLAGLQAEAGMRVAHAEALQVQAGAGDERQALAGILELRLDDAAEADQLVLLAGVQLRLPVAQAHRAGLADIPRAP